ncbi:MAG: ABC transporter permease subunit, partial [Burkholderiales bacterium]|nr:ABC transporter permease subunit [Burkholderiales bacterium]
MATTSKGSSLLPVATVLAVTVVVWYLGCVGLNAPGAIERVLVNRPGWGATDLLEVVWNMERPVLPAPQQVAQDLWRNTTDWPLDSPRNLLLHVAVTAQSTLVGFVFGTLFGVLLAAAIVHSRTLDRALLPWIVASQTVPVLAIAPIVLVILGTLGFSGVAPKAAIAMYLCFFPVAVAMVQGLRSSQRIETELMH